MNNLSWLPDKKYYEYAYHKFFNPEVNYTDWKPWDEWSYPDRDLLRFGHIVKQQLPHIKDKRVLDLACHLGYISLFCLHNNAEFVTGTNVRDRELGIANEICSLAGYSNFNFVNSDIYDLDELSTLCNNHDTIMLCGIIYHVNNHYQLLKTIANSSASCVIIDSLLDNSIESGTLPIISWQHELTNISVNAFENNKSSSFVGIPNHKWFEKALVDLNFKIVYNDIFTYMDTRGQFSKRCVITAIKQ